ncbi:MAG: sulfur oxidation c-type cytochrome SoxA [Alphaproteobacteria bacterium]|nr:sulfur oxidation c-type cytochrome SoxA [Alphaproteobacteria bacterium]
MTRAGTRLFLTVVVAVVAAGGLVAQEARTPRSGSFYLSAETRRLQDDDFLNPGMFAVERGRELWRRAEGSAGKSCASCHEEASMRGVAARLPRYDAERRALVNLPLLINAMRVEHMGAPAYGYESDDMLALSAYVAHQSRGLPLRIEIDAGARPHFEAGKAYYFERRGQLNLACAQCHDDLAGAKLRGDTISQGQINGFPIYRLIWRSMASVHRMFEWCNTSLRAEPHAAGSPEYLALELYVAWRGNGLPIESPAVRR